MFKVMTRSRLGLWQLVLEREEITGDKKPLYTCRDWMRCPCGTMEDSEWRGKWEPGAGFSEPGAAAESRR